MASSIPKTAGDTFTPGRPVFSYAQVAKGRSASVPATNPQVTPQATAPPAASDGSRKESAATSTAPTTTSSTAAASPVEERHALSWRREPDVVSSSSSGGNKETAPSPASPVADPRPKGVLASPARSAPQNPMTAASSPTLGPRSTSTTAKEDDAQSLPNVSFDSAWEKNSQWSTAADDGMADKQRKGSRDNSVRGSAAWLVAAPIPAVNVWQQRKEAQAAKAKAVPQASVTSSAGAHASASNARPSGDPGASGMSPERTTRGMASHPIKGDDERKQVNGEAGADEGNVKGATVADEKDGHQEQSRRHVRNNGSRDEGRSSHGESSFARGDPHDRSGVFKKPFPRSRHERDPEPRVPLAPPPVGDEQSWPTPDIAKDESKRKMQEKSDKDRPSTGTAKPHGKDKWTPVPYIPTVVFETRPEAIRSSNIRDNRDNNRGGRGGRGGARGGGPTSNGSMRGEKGMGIAGLGNSMNHVPSEETTGRESGRGDMPPPLPATDNSPPTTSPKATSPKETCPKIDSSPENHPQRAVSAGPHGNRELNRPRLPISPERRRESDINLPRANNERRWVGHSRRTSSATQTDFTPRPRQGPGWQGRNDGNFGQGPMAGASDRARSSGMDNHHHHTHRASFSDRRGDGPHRGSEPARDGGWHASSGRERGEGRMERSRGGYRGARGSQNHNQPHHHNGHASNHNFNHHHNNTTVNPNINQTGYDRTSHQQPPTQHSNTQPYQTATTTTSSAYAQGIMAPTHGGPYHHPQQQSRHVRQPSLGQPGTDVARSRSQRRHSRSPPRMSHGGFGRYASMPSAPPISQLQTQVPAMYDYQAQQHAMTAIPYGPYVEHYAIGHMVSLQMEYYFSVDNLCKDLYLRKHMDADGFVFLTVIANFNRIRRLTLDMDLIRYACMISPSIELYNGTDGIRRIRRRHGWETWVLAPADRDPSVRDARAIIVPGPPAGFLDGQSVMANELSMALARTTSSMGQPNMTVEAAVVGMHHLAIEAAPTMGGHDSAVETTSMVEERGSIVEMNGASPPTEEVQGVYPTVVNGTTTTNGTSRSTPHAPLSATVPEFSPMGALSAFQHANSKTEKADPVDVFTNKQVDCLMIFVGERDRPMVPIARIPTKARSFSNGSIDEKEIAEALDPASIKLPDSPESDHVKPASERRASPTEPRTPSPKGSAAELSEPVSPVIFWMKGCEAPLETIPTGLTCRYYNEHRQLGLDERREATGDSCPQEMENLYEFWSHFLIRNFNTRMYNEFRQLAMEDQMQRSCDVGIKCLIRYYDASLNSQTTMADVIARDYVNLVESEKEKQEPLAFSPLRNAWRNGALNLKNRKKIDSLLSPEFRTRLDL
ncbi:MAG: hypothetical protein M1823_003828 [Watsoniomyces obsoletus]|nr:MAG: hypothetical protein M1823_003828 [Watsoniomyces obsoletus]